MDKNSLEYYLRALTNIRVHSNKKNGISPHKPILILSVINLIEAGQIKNNRIFITPELVAMFRNVWKDLVYNPHHHCIFALPFYHLHTSSFWQLIAKNGYENIIKSKIAMKSFANLQFAVKYAEIDIELFQFFNHKKDRDILKYAILEKYFPETKINFINIKKYNCITDIENDIINETSENYRAKYLKLQKELQKEQFEEEKFLRGNIFKRQIPILYNNTCAISRLHISATIRASLVDACHIIPFSESFDDTITNGISLTPTIHRAFDRGLISIDENYKILISDKFQEGGNSNFSLRQFEGKHILLPNNQKHFPNPNSLIWHRKNIFK